MATSLPPGAPGTPGGFVAFGPHANCTLDLCPIEWSVYKYRPSVPANAIFLALFGVSIIVHVILGIRWRQWNFMTLMILGSLVEIGGYAGRLVLYNNPFSFGGFMDQIVLITTAPVFYTAGIYITLSKTINFLAPEISRIKPELFYWIFIPIDIICLILQAAGGAMSTVSSGSSQAGVDVAMTGLGLQVGGLFFFSVLFIDYLTRYVRLFIGLEGVLIIIASFCLCVGHPGFIFSRNEEKSHSLHTFDERDNSERENSESKV
ncbi:phospholipid-translocating atpase [Trichoderma arundinaceum]|uniref:Phospholipid-translocating atpase n=1 Tax=Trichoderma arundinaceum TaxID=490622 RepID=A0A395NSE0_TRIAR|nr:phospholipid-translocating atpase [Trichoderma arundinaceum]